MPKGLVRYQKCGVFHFLTFSCYRRRPLLGDAAAYAVFEHEFETVRLRYGFVVAGYVLMPEHVHLLVGEPGIAPLAVALQVLKQQTSRKLKKRGEVRFWQRRYCDFNVWSEEKRVEKLRYMHPNPVRRGLAKKPEDWPWSSYAHYATGEMGVVEIESEWTARRRETGRLWANGPLCSPPFAKSAKDGYSPSVSLLRKHYIRDPELVTNGNSALNLPQLRAMMATIGQAPWGVHHTQNRWRGGSDPRFWAAH
jgi:putative transposase